MEASEYDKPIAVVKVPAEGGILRLAVANSQTLWRAETLYSKEPDTIEWLRSFSDGDVLYDVGANIGLYSLFAAKFRGVRVFAFEPESLNYAVLNQNIWLNELSSHVSAFCLALSDSTKLDALYLSNFMAGGSCHNFGDPTNYQEMPMKYAFKQGSLSLTLDSLVEQFGLSAPNHIKIDVDGIEPKVIAGAKQTIAAPTTRSVLIEINTALDSHWEIVDFMLEQGFTYSEEQVEAARRTEGDFEGVGNYVFKR